VKSVPPLLLASLLVGCGGGEPPPQTPAAPPPPAPAKANQPEAACNELALGMNGLATRVRRADAPTSAAGILPLSQLSAAAFGELRVQMKKALELDASLAPEVNALDATLGFEMKSFEAVNKDIETSAKAMRDVVSEVERLRLPFAVKDVCTKKDVDCSAKARLDGAMERLIWAPMFLAKTREDIAAISFKSPELDGKRTELVRRLEMAERTAADNNRQVEADSKEAESHKEELKKNTEALFKRCGMETLEKAELATKRPQWVTSKEPDLRKMVMVVRVLPEGRIRARLDEWAAVSTGLKREVFSAATQGGFGSGFFVMPKEGEVYVVTNRHVVDFGDRAVLQMSDGTNIAADILYTDPHADLAVLKPDPKKEKDLKLTYGLGLDPEPARDQQVVIATGYPGLGSKPSYQTTRGYVSNQRFTDTFDGQVYIQHTAPVDRGGSGGPLTSEKNLVLGVNTLKIRERENVAMSVPALEVANAVAHAQTPMNAETLRREAREACVDVIAELGNFTNFFGSNALYQRISLSMVSENGSTSFNQVADRELSTMLLDEPIDALRIAVVERLLRDARMAHLNPYEICSTPEPDDFEHILTMDRVRFKVRVGAETKDLVVRREFGRFQLLRFEMLPPQEKAATQPATTKPAPAKKKPQAAKK
jgi:S1-C subfamily serine protease